MELWPLLVDDLLTGSYSVERQLRPRMAAVPTRSDSMTDAVKVVTKLCSTWAGGAMPIVPIVADEPNLDSRWKELILASNLDAVRRRDLIPEDIVEELSDRWGDATQSLLLQLVQSRERPLVQTCRGVQVDDPWYVSYLGTFGDLPLGANTELNRRLSLRDNLQFDDLVDCHGPVLAASAEDLIYRATSNEVASAVELTRYRLPVGLSTGYNKGFPSQSRFFSEKASASSKYGPNIVVVYRPGSVQDLALLWNLRAKFAHCSGLPLAIPYTEDIGHDLYAVAGSHDGSACHYFGFGHEIAVTSLSCTVNELANIATELRYDVVDPWHLLGGIHGYCVASAEVVQFENGSATIPEFTSTDIKELGQSYLGRSEASWLTLTTIVKGHELPPSRTMRRGQHWIDPGYCRGKVLHVGKLHSFTEIFHPSGLEVLRGMASDLSLRAQPSEPGKAAEQLVRATACNISMFASDRVVALISELSRRGHASLVKRRLDQYLAGSLPEASDRYEELREKLDAAIGDPDLEEVGYMTFNRIRELLGFTKAQAAAWVKWAVECRILVRGFEASCPTCGHHQWRALADSVPELSCHGCGRVISDPFGVDRIEHRYRASETLLRVMNSDGLPPILAMRYISEILRDSVFGAYPGVELFEYDSRQPFVEVDCLVLLRNGQWLLGECKTRARGLNERELSKLWESADRVGATATFCATLDRASQCGDLWRVTEDPKGRPHFSLTAEHLYDLQAIGPVHGEDFFGWREEYRSIPQGNGSEDEARKNFGEHLLLQQGSDQKWRRARWEVKYD